MSKNCRFERFPNVGGLAELSATQELPLLEEVLDDLAATMQNSEPDGGWNIEFPRASRGRPYPMAKFCLSQPKARVLKPPYNIPRCHLPDMNTPPTSFECRAVKTPSLLVLGLELKGVIEEAARVVGCYVRPVETYMHLVTVPAFLAIAIIDNAVDLWAKNL